MTWNQVKQELGNADFRRLNEENIAAYQDAKQRADAARDRKLEKREKRDADN